jgi:hypothetical protein
MERRYFELSRSPESPELLGLLKKLLEEEGLERVLAILHRRLGKRRITPPTARRRALEGAAKEMRGRIAIGLGLWMAMGMGEAAAKPPRGLEANVPYCVQAQIERLGARSRDDLRRLEKLCEESIARWDKEFRRRPPGYAQASQEERREVISDVIDCERRWLGRPGTAYEECIEQALEAVAPEQEG